MKKKNPIDLLLVLLALLAALLGLTIFLEIRQERIAQPEMSLLQTEPETAVSTEPVVNTENSTPGGGTPVFLKRNPVRRRRPQNHPRSPRPGVLC